MKKVIYKYTVEPLGIPQRINMQEDAQIVGCDVQHNQIKLWVLQEKRPAHTSVLVERLFNVYGTGHDIVQKEGDNFEFIKTVLLDGGSVVGHLFEIKQAKANAT